MQMTADLIAIHQQLMQAIRRRRRARLRSPVVASLAAAGAVVVTSAALAAGLGLVKISWINVGGKGGLEIQSQPTIPAAARGVPMATVLANDPNLLTCGNGEGGGWTAPFVSLQSPFNLATRGCHPPTRAQREAARGVWIHDDPRTAHPWRYWYLISTASVEFGGERCPGQAEEMGPWYVGSPTPLKPAQLADPSYLANLDVVSSVGKPSPTAIPIPGVPAGAASSTLPGNAWCFRRLQRQSRHHRHHRHKHKRG
jgi:hypothetical protein